MENHVHCYNTEEQSWTGWGTENRDEAELVEEKTPGHRRDTKWQVRRDSSSEIAKPVV